MSEGTLYRLSQRLRLLARFDVLIASDGRRLAGEVHQEIEAARSILNELIDQVLDGHPLGELQQRHVAYCKDLVEANRPAIQQLELEFCPF